VLALRKVDPSEDWRRGQQASQSEISGILILKRSSYEMKISEKRFFIKSFRDFYFEKKLSSRAKILGAKD